MSFNWNPTSDTSFNWNPSNPSNVYIAPSTTIPYELPTYTVKEGKPVTVVDSLGRQTIITLSTPDSVDYYSVYTPVSIANLPPLISSTYEYQDLNSDSSLHQKVMKQVYTNFYNFIIPNQFPYLLNYVKGNNGKYSIVKSLKEYKKNKTRENDYERKLQYIARNVYTKSDMYKDIKTYLDVYDVKWYEIEDKKREVYDMLVNKLKHRLNDLL